MREINDKYSFVTGAENGHLVDQASKLISDEWPEFMLYDPAADLLADCYRKLPEYQFAIVGEDDSEALAIGNSIPIAFRGAFDSLPESGWDWAIKKGIDDLSAGKPANILCALQVVVFRGSKSKGISNCAVQAMLEIGKANGLEGLIAPVRPTLKSRYPLISIDDYILWQDDSGMPFDPWLRVHCRLGAKIIRPCHESMRITGTVAEWESRTNMEFPQTGEYIIPGALVPVKVDVEKDIGLYLEPNVWVRHRF